MKKSIKMLAYSFCVLMLCVCITSCAGNKEETNPWDTAVYTEDMEFGSGEKTIQAEVIVEDNSVTFTVKTDAKTLGEALIEHKLIWGEQGPYGLYVKVVNGIIADYDENQSYWSVEKDGEYMQKGVDSTEIFGGEHFEFIYTK